MGFAGDVQRFEVLLADQDAFAHVSAREVAETEQAQEAPYVGGRHVEIRSRLLDSQVFGVGIEFGQCHLQWRGRNQRKMPVYTVSNAVRDNISIFLPD